MLLHLIRNTSVTSRKTMNSIKTFIFLDLETTGLPSLENNKTKITELSLTAVKSEHLSLGTVPRAVNRLVLCFNPRRLISYDSERITGLSNDMLEHLSPFSASTVQSINLFLEHNEQPLCFVAHNGDGFDYPILQAEIKRTGVDLKQGVLCVDSLTAFREIYIEEIDHCKSASFDDSAITKEHFVPFELRDGFDELLCTAVEEYENQRKHVEKNIDKALERQKINETTPKKQISKSNDQPFNSEIDGFTKRLNKEDVAESNNKRPRTTTSKTKLSFGVSFKLEEVFKRLTKSKEGLNAHSAEGDVQMLLMSVATLGDKFVSWANQNTRKFSDVPAMVPGKKIGT